MNKLITELKRRNVFKVVVLYIITGWLILQAADVLLELAGVPAWGMRLILVILALGFLPALIFSWIYEITPEGIKKESQIDRSHSIAPQTGQKINVVIIAMLAVAIGLMLVQQFGGDAVEQAPEQRSLASTDLIPAEPAAVETVDDTSPGRGKIYARSVAVLPFRNMSSDIDQEFFSEGLSDTLIHVLAQIKDLKVAARTSSFAFKDKSVDVRQIAEQLGVATVLEGSVQKAADRMRIIAQLIDASDGTHLWSGTFDRSTEDIFAIQDEIAQEVVKALKVNLLDAEESRLSDRYQPTLEAYEQFLLGRRELARRNSDALKRAEKHFARASALDPEYALAIVNHGDAILLQAEHGGLAMADVLERVEPLYRKALEVDSELGEAYASLAMLESIIDHPKVSETLFHKAMELSPNYATNYHWYGLLLRGEGRMEEAYEVTLKALELDPLSDIIRINLVGDLQFRGETDQAMDLVSEGLERNPEFAPYLTSMAFYHGSRGRVSEGVRWARQARKIDPGKIQNQMVECFFLLQFPDPLPGEECARKVEQANPHKSEASQSAMLARWRRQDLADAVRIGNRFTEGKPDVATIGVRYSLFWGHFLQEDWGTAEGLLEQLEPDLFTKEEGRVHRSNLGLAVNLAHIQMQTGRSEQARALLDAVWPFIKSGERFDGQGYAIEDARLHAIDGNLEQAMAALNSAVDEGWRLGWWMSLHLDPVLKKLHGHAEYQQLVAVIQTDLSAQQEWLAQHSEDPVL